MFGYTVAMSSQWVVHKFGGTSLADAARFRQAAAILRAEEGGRTAVVVSAMSKVTDALIELIELAQARDDSYPVLAEKLKARHLKTGEALLPSDRRQSFSDLLESDFKDIGELLRGVYLSRTCSDRTLDLITGHGELWSAQLLNAHLNAEGVNSTCLDARRVLTVDPSQLAITVDWPRSQTQTEQWLADLTTDWVVVTGFIASTPDGIATTLKRNGSDFSASIFGKLLGARAITIWTDVDGVLSADPRLVPDAVVLDEVSYQEATELAYFGAKVVHPSTMAPAIENRIPIWIRNTFNAGHPGTKIHERSRSSEPVKGFATVDGMSLINVEGTGMMGVPGVASRLFGALREVGVSVVMISQASSEQSICFAIPKAQTGLARSSLERAFFAELHHSQIQMIDVTPDCSILAAVGDNMVDHPGVAGKFLGALGKAQINIRAIAQGSSERNISAVIDQPDSQRALRAVHSAFYLSKQTISIGILGPGLIGGTLLDQLHAQAERLKHQLNIDLRVRGIVNSRRMFLSEGRSLENWRRSIEESVTSLDLGKFADHVQADHLPHAVIIDCTSSAELTAHYPGWLKRGFHIITPNKKANSGPLEFYRELRSVAREANRHYLYETTVGAGLPVINTLRDLVQTGDEVRKIEGVLSGTLSYIFNTYDGSTPFSALVRDVQQKGYTEPDPRDDLSGMDVARKLVILAREIGLDLELDAVRVQSLVPDSLRAGSVAEFLVRLREQDGVIREMVQTAQERGEVLRYVGVIAATGECSVGLQSYPHAHAFAGTTGSDNIVAFTTARYHTQSLVVRGPGAGSDVTAGGLFADLLRLASYLGA
ncbi:MAG: bifunctional aspartate kinase/homoserine dehydrogenase I [Chthoniobacterales bacterium]|nr:bifunctional aspartate kinase/homoserine dehydrogenase I [Chthoniobacterales bacterium]